MHLTLSMHLTLAASDATSLVRRRISFLIPVPPRFRPRTESLVTNTALRDGVAPDMRLMRPDFPYFGEPYATAASSAKQ